MRRPTTAWSAAIVLACAIATAEPRWVRVVSPNFEVYSSAGAGSAREALKQFEQVRSFFFQVAGHAPAKAVPVRVVVFGSAKEYDTVRFNEFADAFYQPTADRDFIVMSPRTAGTYAAAIHEYVHLVVRHSNLQFPPWLNEGIAELYSTIQEMSGKVLVGSMIPGRQQALLMDKWIPLATIVAADQNSPFYNEKNKAGSLYNEGWALTHMLALRDGYRPKFGQLMAALTTGADTAEAFRTVYGKTVAEIEHDLQAYLRGDRFQGVIVPVKIEKSSEKVEAEPVAPFDVELALAEIQNRPGKETEARARFAKLIADDPKRPEPHGEMAYLEWRAGRTKEAMPEFEKAYELGARGSRLLWDYGRLAEREPERSIAVLRQLLEQEPDRMEVRLELGEVQLRAHKAQDALATFAPIRKVTKSEAPRFFRAAMLAEWEAGHVEAAKAAAENLKKNAASDGDRRDADRVLASIERQTAPPTAAAPENDDAPRLRRATVPAERTDEAPPKPLPSVEGTFERLDCVATAARFVVKTATGLRTLAIEDPTHIAVMTEEGGSVELTCGPQTKKLHVTVEYEAPGTPIAGVDGVVRTIRFHP
jgi:tetratricopeptide (TPR) repeat protein